ncbi:MAG: S4 domain-containing protein [Desulfurivibrio sp.]|nr:S4 domain-containing protein [Desulfurivibrio sp.]
MMAKAEKIRLDIWLWAARFFKTRALAAQAVNGGKVHLNGSRVKAARLVGPDDLLAIRKGELAFTVTVRATSRQRLAAPLAAELYEESPASLAARQAASQERRTAALAGVSAPKGKPAKRDRRLIKKFIRRQE